MTDYVKSTNFTSKDSLASGNPLKIVKGAEIDTEFNNIATAVATKADLNSPSFIGTPVAPTASVGTSTTQLATTAFVASAVTAYDSSLTISTTQIENDAVTSAKIASGAVGTSELATNAVTQVNIADNSVGTAEIINSNVTPEKLSQPLTLGTAVATTSGTFIDIAGIPSWVKRVTLIFNGVSLNGVSNLLVQIGAGSISNSGYVASSAAVSTASTNSTTGLTSGAGFPITVAVSFYNVHGTMVLVKSAGNIWISSHSLGGSTDARFGGGVKELSSTLDRVRLTTVNGTDTFDAGSFNILYE